MTFYEEKELLRQKLWADVWASVAGSVDCKRPDTATVFANAALRDFDDTFPKLNYADLTDDDLLQGVNHV